jgi:type II pantothenate kinase
MTIKHVAIDIGMTNIDLIAAGSDSLLMWMLVNKVGDAPEQVRQALKVVTEDLTPGMRIGVTGGRYRDLPDRLDGFEVYKVDEMQALGLGGLALAGKSSGLVVSAGTGTAMVAARGTNVHHVTGSAVGGGTLLGLSKLLLDTDDALEIDRLALAGDASAVDIMLDEAVGGKVGRLPKNANAVNLGKMNRMPDFSREDLAAGLVRLVAQVIAVIAINASAAEKLKDIILVGHLMDLMTVRNEIDLVGEFYHRAFTIPENPGFGTVMGVLEVMRRM